MNSLGKGKKREKRILPLFLQYDRVLRETFNEPCRPIESARVGKKRGEKSFSSSNGHFRSDSEKAEKKNFTDDRTRKGS